MSEIEKFINERNQRVSDNAKNENLIASRNHFLKESTDALYSYNFSWLSRPIIQYPQDIVAMQEIIWEVKPDLIIETGIAHGGSLIFSASILALIDQAEAIQNGETTLDLTQPKRKVLGLDIDIRDHNRIEIEKNPFANRIQMIQGSSIDAEIIQQVYDYAQDFKTILVCLDSNHTHDHVLKELEAYANLTSINSYCVVFDTIVEEMPEGYYQDRPWNKGDNPHTATMQFLKNNPQFEIDKQIDNKILISVAKDGYLKRVK